LRWAEFGATILVAGISPARTTTISTSIYSDILLGHDGDAYGLIVVSIGLAFVAILASETARARAPVMTAFLELRGVSVRLGRFELEVDAALSEGWTALFGPSGAGKTTLLEIITGLRRPDAGRIVMKDRVLVDAAEKISVAAPSP